MPVPCSRFQPLRPARGLCAALYALAFALPMLIGAGTAEAQTNSAPTYSGPAPSTVNATAGGLVSLLISESDFSDPDGDTLTFSVSVTTRTDVYDSNTYPLWNKNLGRLFFSHNAACELAALTPRVGAPHNTVATITATDPGGLTATTTRTYRLPANWPNDCVNDPSGVRIPIPDRVALSGKPFRYTVPSYTFVDPDFGAWIYTASQADDTALPAWLTFDAATRTLSGTPRTSDAGTISVKVSAYGSSTFVADTFEIRVGAQADFAPPTLSSATLDARTHVARLAFEGRPLDPERCPEPGAWTFKVDGEDYRPWGVTCGTDSVTLRFPNYGAPGLRNHQTVTASYNRWQAGGHGVNAALRSIYFVSVESFTDQPVTLTSAPDVRRPTPSGAVVDGRNLTLTFSEPLNAGSAPAGSAFSVSGGRTGTGTASIDGATVRVTLNSAVSDGETVTVSYSKPGANPLRDRAGLQASNFRHAVRNITGPPALTGATVNGTTLTLRFDEALNAGSSPSGGAFTVTATPWGGTARTIAGSGRARISGATATLTLASSVNHDDTTVTVRYVQPSANPLRDPAGDRVASFSGQAVANDTAAPPDRLWSGTVTLGNLGGRRLGCVGASACSSALTSDRIIYRGEPYRITEVVFTRQHQNALAEWGVRVKLDKAWPSTFRSGASLYVGVREQELLLADGTTDGGAKAEWTETGIVGLRQGATVLLRLGQYTGVSGFGSENNLGIIDLDQAQVTDVSVVSDPGDDDTYRLGDSVQVRVTFSEPVAVGTEDGSPRLKIDLGGDDGAGERWAAYAYGSGTNNLTFAHDVAWPDQSTAGIAVLRSTLELNGGSIQSVADGEDARLAHRGLDPDSGHMVDWQQVAAQAPTVTDTSVVSDPGADDTYGDKDEIRIRVTFSEPVHVTGTPRLKIKMDPNYGEKWADYQSGAGTTMLEFGYTVGEPNISTEGIKVVGDSLELNGGAIRSADTSAAAALAHDEEDHDSEHKVDWRVASDTQGAVGSVGGTPTVSRVAIVSTPATGDTYRYGEAIRIRVTFSEPVQVTGSPSPSLKIDMDPAAWGEKQASYESGRGTSALVFAYYVRDPNYSPQGIKVVANAFQLNAGAIRSVANGTDAELTHGELDHDPKHKVDWRPSLSVADVSAREGTDANAAFTVSLSRVFYTAAHKVTVDYATSDGTATAGADYTATSGTLTFAAGETTKTVNVPILDDAVDEGEETFTLRLSNVVGAHIADGEATGTITNDDPLQKMWLSRFGRTVAGHVTDAVSDRLANPLTGAQVTVGGQRVDLAETEDEAWLGEALTSVARALGASESPAPGDGPDGFGAGLGSSPGQAGAGLGLRGSPTLDSATTRDLSGRELLLGSAFHLAKEGEGGAPGLAAWGRVTVGGFDGEERADAGHMRIDGEVTTGILGADAEWNRLLAGVAVSVSEGEGTFSQPGVDKGEIESTMTTVSPYARLMVNDRLSVWGLAGWGTGDMTITQAANGNQAERVARTDLEMRLAALGGQGALLQADETGGFNLALRADAFYVETEAEAVSNEGNTTADASRVRLALEGSRAFEMGGGTLTPGLELGLRHDGGDAETGTGVEIGGRVSYEDPETGLSVEARVRTLVAHEDSNYKEWGASGAVRLAPGERGRGLSFSLSPTYGAASSGIDRLWGARDARGLAPGHEFEAGQRLQGELGYGLGLFGDRFTGTPNLGFGLSDNARDYRIGWRLTSAVRNDPGFEVNLDATRRESANDNEPAEHGVMLRGAVRW